MPTRKLWASLLTKTMSEVVGAALLSGVLGFLSGIALYLSLSLYSNNSDGTTTDITEDSAEYVDGQMVCPRCQSKKIEISPRHGVRKLDCINCGFSRYIKDGVRLKNNE